MGRHLQRGFTVIELMLVLAITALMLSAVLGNSSRRINDQHYREGVESFRDFLAGTFEDIDAVKNDVVALSGTVEQPLKRCEENPNSGAGTGSPANIISRRGMSECFYTGREITISYTAGQETLLVSRAVKAFVNTNLAVDAAGRVEYRTVAQDDESNVVSRSIDWGVTAMKTKPHSGDAYNNFQLRIVRNPDNGARTLQIKENAAANWSAPSGNVTFCMKNPFATNAEWQAVQIEGNAVTSSGITTTNGEQLCGETV